MLGAGELGQHAEGAGLAGAGAWVPVLGVLDQTLLAGLVDAGRVVLGLGIRFPEQSERRRHDVIRSVAL